MKAPPVREYMTRIPVEAERCESIAEAQRIMEAKNIRHIPVMSGSHLRGLISEHDILQARLRHGEQLDAMTLEEICSSDALTVGPLESVGEVAGAMLQRRVDSAVVVDGGFVVGVFTTTDALRVLSERWS